MPKGTESPKMQVEAPALALGIPHRVGSIRKPCLRPHQTMRGSGTQIPTAEPDAPRVALGTASTQPWLPLAALTHSRTGTGPRGTNKVTEEEIEVPQRGGEDGPQSPSPAPSSWLTSPHSFWKGRGWASVTLSPSAPAPYLRCR